MASVFFDIGAALDDKLANMVDLPSVAWENKAFEPIKDALWLRPTNLQGDTAAITGIKDETTGVYQIEIFAPTGEGKNEATLMSDKIADHFKQDSSMTYNGLTVNVKTVSKTRAANDVNGWFYLSVNVVYYAFSSRR